MTALVFIPAFLSALITAAHFLRIGDYALVATSLAPVALLALRKPWVRRVLPLLLIAAGLFWASTSVELVFLRRAMGAPWIRMAVILGLVTLFALGSSLVFLTERSRTWFGSNGGGASASTFVLTAGLLCVVQLVVETPMLLLERFWIHGGWLQILLLSIYAAVVVDSMADPADSARWRRRIWLLFSAVFFAQLALGIAGLDRFLMSSSLHLPVPAMIIAGPIFRGEGLFMPILFASTVLIVGPAWCSHLCYFGALDQIASGARGRPVDLPAWTRNVRWIILLIIVIAAFAMNLLGVPAFHAAMAGLAFGVVGVFLMVFISRRLGVMVNCVVWCPVGLLANILGKLSPFRVSFSDSCDGCMACSSACRFDALRAVDIERRRPALTCTLCGDCISRCKSGGLEYRLAGKSAPWTRPAFLAVVVALHAACLGIARI